MSTLIKNIPNSAVVTKGNRGLGFPAYTEWFNLMSKVPSLVINSPQQMLIIREPLEDSAALTEESTGSIRKFFTIPLNFETPQISIGLPTDGPLATN